MSIRINAAYFSPTGTTKRVTSCLAERIAEQIDKRGEVQYIDFTLPGTREEQLTFKADDVVIIGLPVYAGRVPNVLVKYLRSIEGNGATAVPIVVYGNRNYDDALIELYDILSADGFNSIGAGAFIGEHAFSFTLAKNRPDIKDISAIGAFAERLLQRQAVAVFYANCVLISALWALLTMMTYRY